MDSEHPVQWFAPHHRLVLLLVPVIIPGQLPEAVSHPC